MSEANTPTKRIITQLWKWVRVDYQGKQNKWESQDEIDKKSVSFGITCGDVRKAAEELGIKDKER